MTSPERFLPAVLAAGAYKAQVIPVSSVVFDKSFRAVCERNQCGAFGRYWVCPPACGEADALIERVRSFSGAILFQTVSPIEDSYDIDGMREAKAAFTRLLLSLRAAVPQAGLLLGAGGCTLCEKCAIDEKKPCRHPEEATVSMEACCVDVYGTAKNTDLKYINGPNTVTYFGMLLF